MTKKHFIELADYIRENKAIFPPKTIEVLAGFCHNQNSNFNKARWIGYIRGENGPSGGKVKQ